MARALTTIHRREGTLFIPGICAMYCARPARACWGKGRRSVTRPSEPFLGGAAPVGTCPGSHREVRCSATTLQSSYIRFSLGQSGGFLPPSGSCSCTPDAPLRPGAPYENGPKTNLWSLVGFVPTSYTPHLPSPRSRPYFLSSCIILLCASVKFPARYLTVRLTHSRPSLIYA